MKRTAIILSFGAATLAATPAYAQNFGISPRVEFKVGYDELNTNLRLFNSSQIEETRAGDIGVGIEAGLDGNLTESLVLGVYAGFELPKISDCKEDVFFTGDKYCIRNKRNVTLGARAGVDVGDGGLIYVKGGYSKASRVHLTYTRGTTVQFDDTDSSSGYHLGGGFELPVSGGVYVKGEYVHSRYEPILEDALPPTTNPLNPNSIDPSRHQIMAGIGFRFGAR